MDEDAPLRIVEENRRLKQKLAELEQQLRQAKAEADSYRSMGKLLGLLKQKDVTLEEVSGQLQDKKHELETAVEKLKARNEQLHQTVATLTLYQQLLESDPDAILGLSRDGRLVLFNQAATQLFGAAILEWRMKPVEEMDFDAVDPGIPAFIRQVLGGGASSKRETTSGSRSIVTTAHLLGTQAQPRGAVVKIAVTETK